MKEGDRLVDYDWGPGAHPSWKHRGGLIIPVVWWNPVSEGATRRCCFPRMEKWGPQLTVCGEGTLWRSGRKATIIWLFTSFMEQSPSWEANQFSASQEIPRILGNLKVHYRVTSVRHLSLSWASSNQSMPSHLNSWSFILILSSHLGLGLSSSLLPPGLPTKSLYVPFLSPIRATFPAYLLILNT